MERVRIGINGMGRIGRNLARVIVRDLADRFELVAVNDIVPVEKIVNALRRDSVHGVFPATVEMISDSQVRIGGWTVDTFAEKDAREIPWGDEKVDVVMECSGFYLTAEKAHAHIDAGAKKVIISAPAKDDSPVVIVGVNDDRLTRSDEIASCGSCTTNCLAPVIKALDDAFGVIGALVSTTHAVTAGQNVVDGFGNERARTALNNIIPTTTGAARAMGRVFPHLAGRFGATGLRVPVWDGSVIEAMVLVGGAHDHDEVATALSDSAAKQNARSAVASVLYVGDRYQVSADSVGERWSSMVLEDTVMAIPVENGTLIKVTSFYDNEIGYSYRMADLALIMAAV